MTKTFGGSDRGGAPLDEIWEYVSVVGKLMMYLVNSRRAQEVGVENEDYLLLCPTLKDCSKHYFRLSIIVKSLAFQIGITGFCENNFMSQTSYVASRNWLTERWKKNGPSMYANTCMPALLLVQPRY